MVRMVSLVVLFLAGRKVYFLWSRSDLLQVLMNYKEIHAAWAWWLHLTSATMNNAIKTTHKAVFAVKSLQQ